jgi:hypothetical protein
MAFGGLPARSQSNPGDQLPRRNILSGVGVLGGRQFGGDTMGRRAAQNNPGFKSQTGTVGNWGTEAPDEYDFSGDEDGYFPVTRLRQQYTDYLATKVLEYEEQKVSRHYYHGAHWTAEEIRILRQRKQPIITFNRINRKVDGITALVQRLRQDPKAFPRSPKNAGGAELATQCIRAALDGMDFKYLDFECTKQAAIDGIGGIELKLIEGDHGDPDIGGDFIFGDDFFYDPRSYKPDFSDARYMGIAKWLDVEAAIELFPDKEEELRTLMVDTGFDLTTHSDREFKWVYVNEQRLRLIEHWYKHKGKWYWAFYCSFILLDQGVSPFLDERNRPMNRYVMFSAAVDHDGDRYGFVRNLKGPQDEVNQRRSKALFISNVTRTFAQKGSVDDVETARRESSRPDGWVEYNKGFEKPMPDDRQADLAAQLQLMQTATSEIDGFANIRPDAIGADDSTFHSGVAINYLQKAGIAELGSFILAYRAWKLRVYRTVWNIVKRTWNQERFIRVGTDDTQKLIQINGFGKDQFGRPGFINAIGDIEVEIVLDEGPDNANLMQDAYEVLAQQPPGTIPPQVLIQMMPIADSIKKQLVQMMSQQDPMAQQAKQLTNQRLGAEVDEKKAGTIHRYAQAAKAASEAHTNVTQLVHQAMGITQSGVLDANTPDQPTPPGQQAPQGPQAPAGPPPMPRRAATVPMTPGAARRPPPIPGARQAPDGRHYIPDPRRPGKYLMVANAA